MADAHHGSHGSGGKSSWVGKAIGGLVLFAVVVISYGIYYLSTPRQTSTDIVLGGNAPPAQVQGDSQRNQGQGTVLSVKVPGNGDFSAHINSVPGLCNTYPTDDPRFEWWTLQGDGSWKQGGLNEPSHARKVRLKAAHKGDDATTTVIQGHACK